MKTQASRTIFSTVAAFGVWASFAPPAEAELEACGGIFLSGDAACEYRPEEECMTECMTVAVEQSCVAQVYDECETSCTATATTECESGCTQTCVQDCTTRVTETGPTCMDLCLADCEDAGDGGACASSSWKSACGRCARHNCREKCEERCGDEPDAAPVMTVTECTPTCTSACSASCTAQVNTQCQIDCQERTYVECEQRMVEHCETECRQTGGAIFCDGQFVNASNLESCADELSAKVSIEIDIEAELDDTGEDIEDAVDDVGAEIDAKVDDACTVSRVGAGRNGLWFAVPLVGLALWRVRRRARG